MDPTQSTMVSLSAAYDAAAHLTPESAAKLCDFCRVEGASLPLDERGNTIFHLLAMHGNIVALKQFNDKKLILPGQDLWIANRRGDTPIHEAVRCGKDEFVKKMLELDRNLVSALNLKGETPLYVAAKCGNEKNFHLLKSWSRSDRELVRADGRTVLHAAVKEEYYNLAIKILTSQPELASARDQKGMTALYLLALKPWSFRSGSSYTLRNLGCWSFFLFQLVAILIYILAPRLGKCDAVKQKHASAKKLVEKLIDLEDDWSNYTGQRNPLIEAARNGIIELVKAILDKFPFAAYTLDGDSKNIVHIAVEQKDSVLYHYLTSNPAYKVMLTDIDKHGNTVLHLATNVGSGPGTLLNQMTWDVYWFKRILYDSLPHFQQHKNKAGKKPKEMFKENHSTMQESAAQAIKDMNNGMLISATLLVTVNYAALFTLPGGYDQEKNLQATYGKPVLLTKVETKSELTNLMRYGLISLVSFLVAMTTIISIAFSPFRSSDFYLNLPLRVIVAMIALHISGVFTMISSLEALKLDGLAFNKNALVGWVLSCNPLLYPAGAFITVIYLFYAAALTYSFQKKGQEILDSNI